MKKNKLYKELKEFFSTKDIQKYNYVFIRFDEESVHKDCEVDIEIADKDFLPLLKKLTKYYTNKDYFIKNFRYTKYFTQTVFYKKDYSIKYHIVTKEVKNNNFLIYDPEEIVRKNWFEFRDGLKVLKPNVECGLMIVRNHLSDRKFSEKHKRLIKRADLKKVKAFLKKEFGYELNEQNYVKRPNFAKNFHRYVKGTIRAFKSKFMFFKDKEGKILTFYGPDGSGKTTVAKHLFEKIKINEGGNRLGTLSSYSLLNMRTKAENYNKLRKSIEKSYSSRVKSYIRNFLSYNEKLLSYFIKILPHKLIQRNFVFERFYLDLFTKSRRYQKYYFKHLEKIYGLLLPKADLTFLMVGKPETIRKRKDELTKKEIEETYKFYYYLFKKYNQKYVEININQSLEKTKEEVFQKYLDWRTNLVLKKFKIKKCQKKKNSNQN
ncbi:MAG: hypothetical protein ACOCP8_03240 [archaeon]